MTQPYPDVSPFRQEKRRQFVVNWVFFIFFLSLIEGPLRKWLLPGFAGPLTLLRDPFAIALYAYAFNFRLILRRPIAQIWFAFAIVTSTFGLVQYGYFGYGLAGWMVGVRSYWLYLPMAFVIARSFHREDLFRLLRVSMWICLPYSLLVIEQYNSGASAFVNRGITGDESDAVGLIDGILRPFGLFTYSLTNVQFTAAMMAVFMSLFLAGRERRLSRLTFFAMALAVGAMSVLTGSRSIYFLVAIIIVFTVSGLVLVRPKGSNLLRIFGIGGFILLVAVLFVLVFPDMFAAMGRRFESAAATEGSIWVRAFGFFFSAIDAFQSAPVFGYGIGAGAPGVARFIGLQNLIFGEGDLERNFNELGIAFGFAMLLLRLATATYVALLAVRLAGRGDVFVLPLAGFFLQPILWGQITNSPLNAFLVWVFAGLVLCMDMSVSRSKQEKKNDRA